MTTQVTPRKFPGPQYLNLLTAWLGLFLGIMIVMSGTFSVFFPGIAAEQGWDRAQVSLAFSIFLMTSTVTLPIIGKLVDQFGSRSVIIGSACVFALATFSIRFVIDSLWQFYAVFALIGIVAGGTSTLPYFKVLLRSFAARRGLALGIANSGTAVGTMSLPLLAYWLNASFGWRDSYAILGCGVLLLTVPIVLLGLNERYSAPGNEAASTGAAEGATLREALRTRRFWLIGFAYFSATTALLGYLVHLVPLLTDRGLSPQTAALAASLFGGAQLVGRLLTGYVLDKFRAVYVAAALWLAASAAFMLLWSGVDGYGLFVATALLGLSWGGEGDVLAYMTGRSFGLRAFGGIYSVLLTINLFGGVVGPFLMGWIFDLQGTYTLALGGMVLVMILASAVVLRTGDDRIHSR